MNLPNFKQNLLRTRVLVLRPWFLGTLLVIFLLIPTQAYARTTTYIGNYEVTTEDNGTKKETVRVAGTMGKIVKSRETNTKTKEASKGWEYTYYTTDAQGSTRQEITESKPIPKPNTYYAYGTPIPVTTSEASLRGTPKQSVLNAQTQKVEDTYTGQKKDEETNLMYYNARYYNPQTGLFIQADSVDDTANKYQYVASNPINNTDDTGNWCWGGYGNTCEKVDIEDRFVGRKPSAEYMYAIEKGLGYFSEDDTAGLKVRMVYQIDGLDHTHLTYHTRENEGFKRLFMPNDWRGLWYPDDNYIIGVGDKDVKLDLSVRPYSVVTLSSEAYPPTSDGITDTIIHENVHRLSSLKDKGLAFKFIASERYTLDLSSDEPSLKLRNRADHAFFPPDHPAFKNYSELEAWLSGVYAGFGSYASAQDLKTNWPDMYNWLGSTYFNNQEYIEETQ